MIGAKEIQEDIGFLQALNPGEDLREVIINKLLGDREDLISSLLEDNFRFSTQVRTCEDLGDLIQEYKELFLDKCEQLLGIHQLLYILYKTN